VDWRIEMADARKILGTDVAMQGNLDPVTLFAPSDVLKKRAAAVIDQMRGHPGFIFNLGHGLLKETPTGKVAELVNFVHEYSSQK